MKNNSYQTSDPHSSTMMQLMHNGLRKFPERMLLKSKFGMLGRGVFNSSQKYLMLGRISLEFLSL